MTTSVIGLDLGHAETAACKAHIGDVREPQPIELAPAQRSIPSAVATAADGGLLIGSEAILAPDASDLAIAFKSMDMRDRDATAAMERFARGLANRLLALGEIDSAEATEVVVGVPSAWPELARLEYRAILQRSGLPGVRLIAESRAALLSAGVSYEQAKAEVLIVDIGSSTTDVTFLTDLSVKSGTPRELGHNRLGGGLIDEALLAVLVSRSGERQVIDDIFARDKGARARALFAVRKAKEDYFTHEAVHRRHPLVKAHYVSARPRVLLDIEIDAETIERIISQPITFALDGCPSDECSHTLSWREAYAGLMAASRRQGSPRNVVLTGGASRMAFVQEITRESFPGARVVVGSEPELAIARGLAQSGRIDIHTAMFSEDAERTFRPALIESAVRQRYPDWKEAIATLYVAELSGILAASLRRWRDSEDSSLKLRDLQRDVSEAFNRRVNQEETQLQVAKTFVGWSNKVMDDLRPQVVGLMGRNHIPIAQVVLNPIAPRAVSLEKDGALEAFRFFGQAEDLTVPAVMVVTGSLAAMIGFAVDAALVWTGGAVGTLSTVLGVLFGQRVGGRSRDWLMSAPIKSYVPASVLKMTLSDGTVDGLLKKQEPTLRASFAKQLDDGGERLKIELCIRDAVMKALGEIREEARLVISGA